MDQRTIRINLIAMETAKPAKACLDPGVDKICMSDIQSLYMQVQTFNIALPKDLVKKVDQVAKKEYRNRSELIREALRIYLRRRDSWDLIFEEGRKAAKRMGIKSEADVDRIVYEFRHGK